MIDLELTGQGHAINISFSYNMMSYLMPHNPMWLAWRCYLNKWKHLSNLLTRGACSKSWSPSWKTGRHIVKPDSWQLQIRLWGPQTFFYRWLKFQPVTPNGSTNLLSPSPITRKIHNHLTQRKSKVTWVLKRNGNCDTS